MISIHRIGRRGWVISVIAVIGALGVNFPAFADVRLPAILSDGMVLQRDASIPLWGWAEAGEVVRVSIGGQSQSATAGPDGRWRVTLDPLGASAEPLVLTVSGRNTLSVRDILVGEVWVAAGQSNMQLPVTEVLNARQEIAAADFPGLRVFSVKRGKSLTPLTDTEGTWQKTTPRSAGRFPATAYFFARSLHQKLKVPVGIVDSSGWGVPAAAYIRREALEGDAYLNVIIRNFDGQVRQFPRQEAEYREKLAAWEKQAGAATRPAREGGIASTQRARGAGAAGGEEPARPQPPQAPLQDWAATALWNSRIAPVIPYGISGVIWYQGEGNAGMGFQYRKLFALLINDWRGQWGQGDFPFLYVMLANYGRGSARVGDSDGGELREAQLMGLRLPNTAMANAMDLGEPKDIHPKNKQEVGRRLALAARGMVYGEAIAYSGPVYDSMKVEDGKVRLAFKQTAGGLVVKAPGGANPLEGDPATAPATVVPLVKAFADPALIAASPDGTPISGFSIAGADRVWAWAEARVEGNTIVVWNDAIPRPVAVRYAWTNPECTLYNTVGLPAPSFRTDEWPGLSDGKNW